jgi:hypothetical protein
MSRRTVATHDFAPGNLYSPILLFVFENQIRLIYRTVHVKRFCNLNMFKVENILSSKIFKN